MKRTFLNRFALLLNTCLFQIRITKSVSFVNRTVKQSYLSVVKELFVILYPDGRRKSSLLTSELCLQHSMTQECMTHGIPAAKHCIYFTVRR